MRAIRGLGNPVANAISESVGASYDRSGLRQITRQLISAATQGFTARIELRGQAGIKITAEWKQPQAIDYFLYQLLGFQGAVQVKAHRRVVGDAVQNVRAHTRQVDYAGRPFIRLSASALNKIIKIFNRVFVLALDAERRRMRVEERRPVRRPRPRPRREEIVEIRKEVRKIERVRIRPERPRRLTRFRARKTLRRRGIPAPEARRIAAALFRQAGLSIQAISELIQIGERDDLIRVIRGLRVLGGI